MTTPVASLSVFAGEQCACVRLSGRATFALGVELKLLLDELQAHDFNYFVLELSECVLMDSTILGILTGFGLNQQKRRGAEQSPGVELRNPHERVAEFIKCSFGISTCLIKHATSIHICINHQSTGTPFVHAISRCSSMCNGGRILMTCWWK